MEIYLDNSATTKPYKEVIEKMVYALQTDYANPSSIHSRGVEIEKQIKEIRQNIARSIGVKDKEILFTSGATEANNAVLRGVINKRKNHIISTEIEHPSVLSTLKSLENEGVEVTYLKVNSEGIIDILELKNSIKSNTALVSVMHVNNEVGSIQPIFEIGKYLKTLNEKVYFHVDCVQSYQKINFKPSKYNIDFLTVSAHKFHGPKGIGFMYIKENSNLKSLITGSGQEFGFRSGTPNVPGIYGMGEAIRISNQNLDKNIEQILNLRNLFKEEIIKNIKDIKINTPENSVCHILNVSFYGIKGEVLLHYLEQKNIFVSIGAACSSKKKGSHVLNAMHLSECEIEGAIRFSLSDMNTKEEIIQAIEILKESVEDIRLIIKRKR
ncbi:MAG: cysteine desulfurase family protein [Peptostreptococcaceae bacterium]